MSGRTAASWKPIRRPERRSWWRSASGWRKSEFPITPRRIYPSQWRHPPPRSRRCSQALTDDVLLSYGVPAEWLADVRHANEDSLLDLADHLPAEAAEALLELATGGKPQITPPTPQCRPLQPSRCPAPVPGDERCGGTGTRPGVSVGEVDDLPSPRPAAVGGARLQRAGAGFRFGRYRQDYRRAAPGGVSGA